MERPETLGSLVKVDRKGKLGRVVVASHNGLPLGKWSDFSEENLEFA